MLGEVLPYLEVIKDNVAEEDIITEVEVPDIVGKTIKEAKQILKESNLEMEIMDINEEEIDNEMVISEQIPVKVGS